MIVRKSNLDDQSRFVGKTVYAALAWLERPEKRRLAYVTLRAEEADVKKMILRDVIIDGSNYLCLDVRTFSPPPFKAGDSIGLLVVAT
jgi:hypothetical protein